LKTIERLRKKIVNEVTLTLRKGKVVCQINKILKTAYGGASLALPSTAGRETDG